MRVLVACEYSGRVREAFAAKGHEALSCDLLPAEDGGHHYQGDVKDILYVGNWDMMIAFPPCTHLAVSGAKHFSAKRADGRQQEAIEFFMMLAKAPIKHIAIENPIGIMSELWRQPDCIIHPWEHGHPESKSTCLWLKNLPPIIPTKNVYEEMMSLPVNIRNRVHYMAPSEDRWKERSRTYEGFARAFADQWGNGIRNITMDMFEEIS